MTDLLCPACLGTGNATERRDDRTITIQCPDCAAPRMTADEWERQLAKEYRAIDAEMRGD